jgi:hypothetical protein
MAAHCGVPAPDDPTVAPGQIGGGDLVVPTIGHEGAAAFTDANSGRSRVSRRMPHSSASVSPRRGEGYDVGISRQQPMT